ncbi:hypothetical protein [Maribacter stanieri]|uniref:Uncharacterized protein n=1 Tax=Maribacter stanieri TaxID=440514 RepID=A0A1I6J200_9FLAO|nr:hypothetical protein [Maribacter stanieri]SFR72958.1 hypothetical protein SAMN04488010_2188 [Maribacter stanieri]
MKITTTILLFLVSTFFAFSQTPVQSYFEWTDLPFTKEELSTRRDNLANTLKREGETGLAVIPANDGFSFGETFR